MKLQGYEKEILFVMVGGISFYKSLLVTQDILCYNLIIIEFRESKQDYFRR